MTQSRRRVSYILPHPTNHGRRLQLPPAGSQRLGAVAPLLTAYPTSNVSNVEEIPSWARHPRHRLGVSALALDTSTCLAGRNAPEGILYSGGRDGLIIARDLAVPMKRRKVQYPVRTRAKDRWEILTGWADDAIEEEVEEEERGPDGDVLGEVTLTHKKQRSMSASAAELPLEQRWETDFSQFTAPGTHSEFRQSAQAHSDWINDILLCNYNQNVVSASSDGTIKSWSPHSHVPTDPVVIGTHTDYVRCLSLCRERNWVASGSFDRTIKLWDLTRASQSPDPLITLNPADATASKSSVYALASDPFGRTIVSGSPERVVRLWDPRTGKRTGKLVGHTDNIRAILLSEDGRYLLTGSTDASIKLWSLRTQKSLHTFTHHTDSVWSLYAAHPSLETFYSGDRSGLVCRVDVEDVGDLGEGECILLCNDSAEATRSASEGINRIAVMDDNMLWTASGSSTIKRWQIPPRRSVRVVDGGDLFPPQSPPKRRQLPSPPVTGGGVASDASSRTSTSYDRPRRMSSVPSVQSLFFEHNKPSAADNKLNGIPLDSLVKLLSPNDPFGSFVHHRSIRDAEVATMYSAASVMSVPRTNIQSPSSYAPPLPPPPHTSPLTASRTEDTVNLHAKFPFDGPPNPKYSADDRTASNNIAHAKYEERELASDATPFCTAPSDTVMGEAGLVRSVILNDRVHALTVDTVGEVACWDIVRGVCLGRWERAEVEAATATDRAFGAGVGRGSGEMRREISPRESLEVVRERIEGDGVASTWCTVDTKAGVLTVHLTERCFDAEVYADEVGFVDKGGEETKLNMGKWVLRNLFYGFIKEEMRIHAISRESPPRDNDSEGVLPPSISRASGEPPSSPPSPESHRKLRHRTTLSSESGGRRESQRKGSVSTSSEFPRKATVKHVPMSSTVVCSPKMIPAVSSIPTHALPKTSPLLTPMIPLLPPKELTTPIVPSLNLGPNAQTPTQGHSNDEPGPPLQHQRSASGAGTGGDDYFMINTRQPSMGGDDTPTTGVGAGLPGVDVGLGFGQSDGRMEQTPSMPTPSTPASGLIGRLKNLGKMGKRPVSDSASPVLGGETPTLESVGVFEHATPTIEIAKTPIRHLLSGPLSPPSNVEAPLHAFPAQTVVLISEENTPSYRTLYRGYVSSTQYDLTILEECMPMWLAEYLLLGKIPLVSPLPKLSFILLPWNRDLAAGEEPLAELLNSAQSKLTASRYLRVSKILLHVQDKLEKMSAASAGSVRSSVDSQNQSHHPGNNPHRAQSPRPKAEEVYEILCNEAVLPSEMTLAAVKQYVWRQGTELVMYYKRKAGSSEQVGTQSRSLSNQQVGGAV